MLTTRRYRIIISYNSAKLSSEPNRKPAFCGFSCTSEFHADK